MISDKKLARLEEDAIFDIQDYMLDYFNCRVHGNDLVRFKVTLHPPKCDFTKQKAFVMELTGKLKDNLTPYKQVPYEEIIIDNGKAERFSNEALAPYLAKSSKTCYLYWFKKKQGELNRSNILCVFTSLDSIVKFVAKHKLDQAADFLEYCNAKRANRIMNCTKEAHGFTYTFEGLDLEDRRKLYGYVSNDGQALLGEFFESYLEKMLDFNSPSVCSLMPYLLSAYIYNFKRNQLVRRGTTFLSMAFDEEHVSSDHASDIRKK